MLCMSEHPEYQYLDLIGKIMEQGEHRDDRTGTGTIALFAPPQLRFQLDTFPLLTTKRVFLRPVFEELMWFIRGQTDANILHEKKVYIWDANGSKEALEKQGLPYAQGDLGPVYGFQWRHFGADYTSCDADYSGKGVDQLRQVIHSILFKPHDRRIILSAWNPQGFWFNLAIPKMALPPCHMFCQFFVSNGKLSCQLYQRSCDMGLGVPFNIASYSMMTYMIAHLCGLEPGEFVHCMGDTHVYSNHVDPLKLQLEREPRPFPRLEITKPSPFASLKASGASHDTILNTVLAELESFEFGDFIVHDYQPHPKIVMDMSV